ncbi:leucine-rich repeat domain-containing protein [Prevotella sp.]|uniref:leucine-rich repeat domain-containing protein n=1 Tax=Prevotella sp. TaxID=59823 RepID=UPI00257DD3E6|nr:leucine-rich repeat domain-containing protein [Prevotella sp.]
MKQIYILLIALLMGLSANAKSSGTCGPNLKWHLTDDGVLTISGKGEMDDYNYHDGSPWKNSGVKRIIIGDSVTTIGEYAFSYCRSLTSVTIPNSVTTIGRQSFSDCSSLTSVTIGNNVTRIGDNAFNNTNKTKKIIWLTNTPPDGYGNLGGGIHYVANDLYTRLSNKKVYPYLSSIFEMDGIKYVPVSPSERTCDALDCIYTGEPYEVKINKKVNYKGVDMTVREINPYTAYDCAKIKKAYIDIDGSIGDNAFCHCANLLTVNIAKVNDIGNEAFNRCANLSTVNIAKVNDIGNWAFSRCTNLTSVDIKKANDIGNRAFSECTNLASVDIKAVNNIGESAFRDCSSLITLSLDKKIKSLGQYAFRGCSNLTQFVIPDSVTILNSDLLDGCSSLKSIRIHKGIKEIYDAFSGCTNLSTLIIEDRNTSLKIVSLFNDCKLDSVYIGGKIVYETSSDYRYSPFSRNTSLRTVKISDAETTIYDNEFYGCTNLQNVSIGDNVKSIGKWAFSGCSSLKNFTFGSGLQSIGQEAFSDCINITQISSEAVVPPTCGINALDDINKWNCKLFVPKTNINAYKQAPQWKEFFFIEGTTGITNTVYNKAGLADVYTIDGTKRLSKASTDEINALPKGVYIVNGKKIIIK